MNGDQLRRWRLDHYLTQVELADLLGDTVHTVNRWENGRHRVPPHLELALRYLDMSQKWVPLRSSPKYGPSEPPPSPAAPVPA